jgi:hypothetical protein
MVTWGVLYAFVNVPDPNKDQDPKIIWKKSFQIPSTPKYAKAAQYVYRKQRNRTFFQNGAVRYCTYEYGTFR